MTPWFIQSYWPASGQTRHVFVLLFFRKGGSHQEPCPCALLEEYDHHNGRVERTHIFLLNGSFQTTVRKQSMCWISTSFGTYPILLPEFTRHIQRAHGTEGYIHCFATVFVTRKREQRRQNMASFSCYFRTCVNLCTSFAQHVRIPVTSFERKNKVLKHARSCVAGGH